MARENENASIEDTTPKRKGSRWVDAENREWVREVRTRSTPKKRVISDEHWKKRGSPKGLPSGQSTPRRDLKRDEGYQKAQQESPVEEVRQGQGDKRRRRRGARISDDANTSNDRDDGARVLVTPPSLRRQSGKNLMSGHEDSNLASNVDDDPPQAFLGASTPKPSTRPQKSDGHSPSEHDVIQQKQSRYTETLAWPPAAALGSSGDGFGSVPSKKGSILSQAKDIFIRLEPVPITTPRLPSIEAWLEEQPDPFVEEASVPVEVPAPLKPKARREAAKEEEAVLDNPNNIRMSIGKGREEHLQSSTRERRRRRRVYPISEREGEVLGTVRETEAARADAERLDLRQDEREASPGVHRSGARSSRRKRNSRLAREETPESEQTSSHRNTTSSSVSPREVIDVYGLTRAPLSRPKRPPPPPGAHRLSTIVSVETFQEQTETISDEPQLREDGDGLKRRLTTHEDLMSVLSLPRAGQSIRSARSIRTMRNTTGSASMDLLNELAVDETKYMRELRTLVDGVVPVLLQCVLSKSDSAAAAGLFTSSSNARDDLHFTKPIIDMGVALERLKVLHKRIPTSDLDSLLSWAQSAYKVYAEYLVAWRLGFQDVVVNLAPADEHTLDEIEQGMARDEDGDIVNADGKKVDVAYLLKRPLVRTKNLYKVFNRLRSLRPSAKASKIVEDYNHLVETARRRSNEEQERLESEAAANLDPGKARDVRTMAVLAGVTIDKTRRVKAKDYCNLTLHHSSGQRIDCRVELLFRDNQHASNAGGDLLICEVEDSGRWLLFPPVEPGYLSARLGEMAGDLVIMIRGRATHGREWHELLYLRTDDVEAAADWVEMLGQEPVPPNLDQSPSFINRQQETITTPRQVVSNSTSSSPGISRVPSLRDIDVPIGEPSMLGELEARPAEAPAQPQLDESLRPPTAPYVSERGRSPCQQDCTQLIPTRKPLPPFPEAPLGNEALQSSASGTTPSLSEGFDQSQQRSTTGLRRMKAGRRRANRDAGGSPSSPVHSNDPRDDGSPRPEVGPRKLSRTDDVSREWMSSPEVRQAPPSELLHDERWEVDSVARPAHPERPGYARAISSTPSMELPTIARIRPPAQIIPPSTPTSQANRPLNEAMKHHWSAMSTLSKKEEASPTVSPSIQRAPQEQSHSALPFTEDLPVPPLQRSRSPSPASPTARQVHSPKPTPHREKSPIRSKLANIPLLKSFVHPSPRNGKKADRRSSSPLKLEYAPSDPSSYSSSDSESDDSIDSPSSESGDTIAPLQPITGPALRRASKLSPPSSLPMLASATLAPSNSASQAPYRTVPSASAMPYARPFKTIAMVCSWSDKGLWEALHPDECSIVVSPGLIEAYEISAAHSASRLDSPKLDKQPPSDASGYLRDDGIDVRPLVGFELTPLVPLRRGTALDISIRSPPTEKSKITTSNNVMFRSRNAEECEALYAMINHARINNPTYIALQNARPSYQPPVSFNTNDGRSKSGSWFGFGSRGKRSSFRASSAPTASSPSVGVPESSVGSMSSAFSALKLFGSSSEGRGMFNLNRSSVIRKNGRFGGSYGGSLYSSSSGTGGGVSGAASPAPSQFALPPRGLGTDTGCAEPGYGAGMVNNMKIRLYIKDSTTRWQDLGAGRLSVLPPELPPGLVEEDGMKPRNGNSTSGGNSPPATAAGSRPPSTLTVGLPGQDRGPRLPSSDHTPHRVHGKGQEKRIVITGKKGQPILDATLHESCFEKVAKLGIAMNVWEEHERIAKQGGVVGGKSRTYIMQLKGEAESRWVFGLVGRFRY